MTNKITSPKMARLAAKVLRKKGVKKDIKRLAACVLSQRQKMKR